MLNWVKPSFFFWLLLTCGILGKLQWILSWSKRSIRIIGFRPVIKNSSDMNSQITNVSHFPLYSWILSAKQIRRNGRNFKILNFFHTNFYQLIYQMTHVAIFPAALIQLFADFTETKLVSLLRNGKLVFYLLIIIYFSKFLPTPWILSAEKIPRY